MAAWAQKAVLKPDIAAATSEAWRRLQETVNIPTQSAGEAEHADSNFQYIDNLRSYLTENFRKLGVPADQFHIVEITNPTPPENPKPQKVLLVRVGPQEAGGIMFSGHSDVVSTAGQEAEWDTPPYQATIKNVGGEERMYGRGVVDVKGLNEAAIQAVLMAARNRAQLKKPVYLAITHSEELGPGLCKEDLRAAFKTMEKETGAPVSPEAVIVAEPTDSGIIYSHKGAWGITLHFQGKQNSDAFEYAANLSSKLISAQEQLMKDKTTHDAIFDPPYAVINPGLLTFEPGSNKAHLEIHTRTTGKVDVQKVQQTVYDAVAKIQAEMGNPVSPPMPSGGNVIETHSITFNGAGGHSAYPEMGVSVFGAVTEVMRNLQAIRKENPDVHLYIAASRGIGNASNALAGNGELSVTLQGDNSSRIAEVWQEIQGGLRKAEQNMLAEKQRKNAKLKSKGEELIVETKAFGIRDKKIDPIILPEQPQQKPTIEKEYYQSTEPSLLPKPDKGVLNKISASVDNSLGRKLPLATISYVTDAGYISDLLPNATVAVFGPGKIFEQAAHSVNEYITRTQMQEAIRGNFGLTATFCQEPELKATRTR